MDERYSIDSIGYSRRMNFDRPEKYDVAQLDLEWFPALQELLENRPNETRSRQVVEREEVRTRFRTANDLERGNTLIRNYRDRSEQSETDSKIYPETQKSEDKVDFKSEFTTISQPLVNKMSTREQIHNRGIIDVKALQERLLGWNRKDLEKHGISRNKLQSVIRRADRNRNGKVEYEDFLETVSDYRLKTEQASKITQIGKALAYAEEFTCWPPKLFIILVTILELGIYLYHVVHFPSVHDLPITWHGPVPYCSVLIYDPYRRWEAWRYVTYMCVHIGISHLVFNMTMQIMVGVFLEMEQSGWIGSLRIATVYMSGVISGALGQSLTEPRIYIAGASGGVYALIAAHLSTLVLNWKEDDEIQTAKKVIQFGLVKWIRIIFILMLVVVDTVHQISGHLGYLEGDNNTSVMGHLCGALAGLTVGIFILDNRRVESWEGYVQWVSLSIFLITLIFGIAWNIWANDWLCGPENPYCIYPGPDHSIQTEYNCRHYHA